VLFLDTSALLKLAVDEDHSAAARSALTADNQWLGSEILRVELVRTLMRTPSAEQTVPLARDLLQRVRMVPVDRSALEQAARLTPRALRSLNALHLAAALTIPGLTALVTYDKRLAEAARLHGLPVAAPGLEL
jgi:predicted nucleic acid-binding protein